MTSFYKHILNLCCKRNIKWEIHKQHKRKNRNNNLKN